MSFLTKTARLPITTRCLAIQPSARFSTSTLLRKDFTDTVKETAKSIDRTISDSAVKGIELGESAAQKVKETAGMSSGEAQGKASEMAGEAQGKASEMAGEAQGKVHEMAGQAKGKASELQGKAKANMQ